MTVTVYTRPNCGPCSATKRALEKAGIDFTIVDLVEDTEALATVKALGYLQAPVVVTDSEHWGGFRPDRIKALA